LSSSERFIDKTLEITISKINVLKKKLDTNEITYEEFLKQTDLVLEEKKQQYGTISSVKLKKEHKDKPSIEDSIVVWFVSLIILLIVIMPVVSINYVNFVGVGLSIVFFLSALISSIYSKRIVYTIVIFCFFLPQSVMFLFI
jgi:hypothetical protein